MSARILTIENTPLDGYLYKKNIHMWIYIQPDVASLFARGGCHSVNNPNIKIDILSAYLHPHACNGISLIIKVIYIIVLENFETSILFSALSPFQEIQLANI